MYLVQIGLFWFIFLVLLALLCYKLQRLSFLRNMFLFVFLLSSLAIIVSIIIRVFVLEIYRIPSSSMEDAIIPGERVLISKLHYGAVLSDFHEIPWVNLFYDKNIKQTNKVKYTRLTGLSTVKRWDIIAFKSVDDDEILIKRCIGLPGEYIRLQNNCDFINSKRIKSLTTYKHPYKIWFNDSLEFNKLADQFDIWYNTKQGDNKYYALTFLSNQVKEALERTYYVDSIRYHSESVINDQYKILTDKWNLEKFGPLYIPKKGSIINLTKNNFELYKTVFQSFENVNVTQKAGSFYVNGAQSDYYIFKNNYYFMLGDNRQNSIDSRYWGILPESMLIGKAVCILFPARRKTSNWINLIQLFESDSVE